jgi:hypothetical protein
MVCHVVPFPLAFGVECRSLEGNGSTHFQKPRDTGRRADIPRSMSSHSSELGSMFAHGGHSHVLQGQELGEEQGRCARMARYLIRYGPVPSFAALERWFGVLPPISSEASMSWR